MVATGSPAAVAAGVGQNQLLRLRLAGGGAVDEARRVVAALPEVTEVDVTDGELVIGGRSDMVVAVVRALDRAGLVPVDLSVHRTSLEDAFVRLVGGAPVPQSREEV